MNVNEPVVPNTRLTVCQKTNLPEKFPFEPVPVIIIDEFLKPPKGTVAAPRQPPVRPNGPIVANMSLYRIRTGVVALHVAACCPDPGSPHDARRLPGLSRDQSSRTHQQ